MGLGGMPPCGGGVRLLLDVATILIVTAHYTGLTNGRAPLSSSRWLPVPVLPQILRLMYVLAPPLGQPRQPYPEASILDLPAEALVLIEPGLHSFPRLD